MAKGIFFRALATGLAILGFRPKPTPAQVEELKQAQAPVKVYPRPVVVGAERGERRFRPRTRNAISAAESKRIAKRLKNIRARAPK